MKKTDYIIVGDGYAAMFFAHRLITAGKDFLLFSEGKKSASQISAGVINPVVLKKFTTFWKAQEQIDNLKTALTDMEAYLGKNFFVNEPVHRIFHDENEKALWQKKSQTVELKPFISNDFKTFNGVNNPFGTGEVLQSARLDVTNFFSKMFDYLSQKNHLVKEKFDYSQLYPKEGMYREIGFNKIIFAEGMGVKENPYFGTIEVQPNKGHNIRVALSKDFSIKETLKKKHFLFPLGDLHYYGGTYDRGQIHTDIDENAISQLENGLREFYPYNFEIVEKNTAFRPTVKDRRPILGRHSEHENLSVFNGLGARGVLNGNYFSEILYRHIEYGEPLPAEVDLQRFQA